MGIESQSTPRDEMGSGEKNRNDMMNPGKAGIVVLGVVVLLIGGILLSTDRNGGRPGSRLEPPSGGNPFIGKIAPDFQLADVEGNQVSLTDLQGKVVVINFWATWCAPCREEIPGFVKLQDKYGDDLAIVGISMDLDGPAVVPQFVEDFGINYIILYGDEAVSRAYGGITGIPTSFVLDRNLVVRRVYIGYRPDHQFEQDIESLI
ncbi:MAG: TlpA family protein disulfide reductase [Fidelibacterota bacterium]